MDAVLGFHPFLLDSGILLWCSESGLLVVVAVASVVLCSSSQLAVGASNGVGDDSAELGFNLVTAVPVG